MVSLTQVSNVAVEILNASQPASAYGTIVSERFKAGECNDVILFGDASTVHWILKTRGHGRRKDFLTGSSSGIAHGAQLASRVGPLETIVFVVTGGEYAGTIFPVEWPDDEFHRRELARENRNVLAESEIEPHYIISGGTLFHNAAALVAGGASSVSVNSTWCQFVLSGACQAPDEFVRADALAALAILMQKDGNRVSSANLFETMYRGEMAGLGVPIPATAPLFLQEAA